MSELMRNRIDVMFEHNRAQGRKSLITFVTAGDPDITTTREIVLGMIHNGADLVELGVPYSDPIAEGPVIQAANERALAKGIRLGDLFSLVGGLRGMSDDAGATGTPIVFLLYVNSIVQYGADRFFAACRKNGVDGVIVPDLPYEERGEIQADADRHGIHIISMVAPTSRERIGKLVEKASGFLYCVSSLGVTGVRSDFKTDFSGFFGAIDAANAARQTPTAIGFGISTPEQVREVKQYADGVIVGSAFVKLVANAKTPEEAVQATSALTAALREAL